MKSRSTIKSTNNSTSFLSTGPSIIQPIKGKRKILQQNDNYIDLIRSFSKSNKQGNENLIKLLELRDEMIKKISKMEGELIRNNDLISSERHQLAIYGGEHLLNDHNSEDDIVQQNNQNIYPNYDSLQSDETSISKAIQNCIVLQPFLNFLNDSLQTDLPEEKNNANLANKFEQKSQIEFSSGLNLCSDFRQFLLLLRSLDAESYSNFMKSSFSQLNWISECNKIYQKMRQYIESETFIENFQKLTEQLFFTTHNDVIIFIFDQKTNEYTAFNEKIDFIEISLTSEKSILSTIIDNQTPEIVKSPPNNPSYSESVDKLFNKVNQPFFAFPIEKNALVMVFRLEEPFNNEDFVISQFYSNLMAPIFDIHVKNILVSRQIKQRRAIREFEANLAEKVTFNVLLPYLLLFISNEIGANDARFFVVGEDSFISIELEDDQISQKKFPKCGVAEYIVKKKNCFITEKLNNDTFKNYDETIDNWSADTSLIGFPIFSDKTVIAVLLLSEKVGWNKFNQWDIETMQTVSADLSLVVPFCVKNDSSLNITSLHQNFESTFPTSVQSLTFKKLELNEGTEIVLKTIQTFLNCEWLSIYKTISTKTSKKIQKVATLHNGKLVDTEFLDPSFVKAAFKGKKSIQASDAAKTIDGFKTVGNVSPGDFLFVFNGESNEKVGAFALNSKSGDDLSSLDNSSTEIVSSLAGFVFLSLKIREQACESTSTKQSALTVTNAFSVCESISNDQNSFQKLIDVLKQLLGMDSFVVLRFSKSKGAFEPVVNSENCVPIRAVGANDSLTMLFGGLDGLMYISDFLSSEFNTSAVSTFFISFKQLLIAEIDEKQRAAVVFAGRSCASNYKQLFQYFTPLLKVFYRTFVLNGEVKYIESAELNSINFFNSKLADSDLTSLSFESSSLSDPLRDEALLLMFESLGIDKYVNTNTEQLATFLVRARHGFKSEVPFHNHITAVCCTQFMYVILTTLKNSGEVKFPDWMVTSLMLSALLHDIEHEGYDNNFLKRSFSPLVYAHGKESTLEHFHVSAAVSLLQDSLLVKDEAVEDSPLFWSSFVSAILATDDAINGRFCTDIKSKNGFDLKSEGDLIDLSKLLLKIADASRCFRPFEACRRSAELLMEERKRQNEACNEMKIEHEELKKVDAYETDFIDTLVEPLVQILCKIDSKLSFLLERLKITRISWSRFNQ